MNLRGIANAATRSVNPNVQAVLYQSLPPTTNPDYSRKANFRKMNIVAQVQALTYSDLIQLDGLNIEGIRRAVYINGFAATIIRPAQKGGDLIKFADGTFREGNVWLVAHALETWPDWCKFAITLQNDTAVPT